MKDIFVNECLSRAFFWSMGALPMAPSLRVYAGGAGFLGCLWPVILLMPIFGLPQGPSWRRTHLSIKTYSRARVSGRFAGLLGAGVCSLLLVPPEFFQLVLAAVCRFLIGTSCCNSCKKLFLCLATVGSFGKWFPNTIIPLNGRKKLRPKEAECPRSLS